MASSESDAAPTAVAASNGANDVRTFQAKNVSCVFSVKKGLFGRPRKITAVNDVTMELRRGEVFGIVGESGSGKSTLAKILLGLQPPTAGSIFFEGKALTASDMRVRSRSVQAVFQDPYSSLNPRRTVGESVRRPLDIHRVGDPSSREAEVRRILLQVGLSDHFYYTYPVQMSGGQRQRVAIARALVMKPKVLICDEPTSALDVSVQAQILNLLLDLRRELNLTYVMISHDLGVIRYVADRVAVMHNGDIVESGDAAEVLDNPRHDYTRKLLSSVLTLRIGDRGQPNIA